MHKPKRLSDWDFSDTVKELDGYDLKTIPDLTRDNFQVLIEEYNNLVAVVNMLCDKRGIIFDD